MSGLNDLLHNPQAANLANNPEQLSRLMGAPETQRILSMLNQNTGGTLEQAAGKAANGDTAPLMDAIKRLMQDPEGIRLVQQMKEKLKP